MQFLCALYSWSIRTWYSKQMIWIMQLEASETRQNTHSRIYGTKTPWSNLVCTTTPRVVFKDLISKLSENWKPNLIYDIRLMSRCLPLQIQKEKNKWQEYLARRRKIQLYVWIYLLEICCPALNPVEKPTTGSMPTAWFCFGPLWSIP